jgi:patatin-like phospholipase/acyl hydrolase
MKRILSIDGGGIKGVFPAAFLASLEADLKRPIGEYFDLIAGTSTGGIIAIGLAMGLTAKQLLDLYEERGPEIFSQADRSVCGKLKQLARTAKFYAWGPKYTSGALEAALKDVLGDRRLGEAKTRLLIPAWHGQMQSVYIFKTPHHARLKTDYKELARDAAMATAAAPTYFREYITARDVGLVDGGVWANNPTGIAVTEAIGTLGWSAAELQVLSIGCLEEVTKMRDAYGAAGLIPKLAGLFMAGQSHGALGIAHILTGDVGGSDHRAIHRINQPVPEGFYSLDDTGKIKSLKSRAVAQARIEKPKLDPIFFSTTAEPFQPLHKA